jgi:hypothetical protein
MTRLVARLFNARSAEWRGGSRDVDRARCLRPTRTAAYDANAWRESRARFPRRTYVADLISAIRSAPTAVRGARWVGLVLAVVALVALAYVLGLRDSATEWREGRRGRARPLRVSYWAAGDRRASRFRCRRAQLRRIRNPRRGAGDRRAGEDHPETGRLRGCHQLTRVECPASKLPDQEAAPASRAVRIRSRTACQALSKYA